MKPALTIDPSRVDSDLISVGYCYNNRSAVPYIWCTCASPWSKTISAQEANLTVYDPSLQRAALPLFPIKFA